MFWSSVKRLCHQLDMLGTDYQCRAMVENVDLQTGLHFLEDLYVALAHCGRNFFKELEPAI